MTIEFLGDGGKGAGTANVTYSIPAGTQTGDLLLMFIETANQTVISPGEWLDVPDSPQGVNTAGGTTATRLKILYRWIDGTSITTTVTDPGNHQVGAILAFRGVDPTNPFNASAGATKSGASTACTFPSVTTTVDNCWVLLAEAHALPDSNTNGQTSAQAMASLTGLAEEVDYNTNSGNGGGFSVAAGIKETAGSTGTGSAKHSTSTANATITLALAPYSPPQQDLTQDSTVTNGQTFYSPTVAFPPQALTQTARFDDAQTFYAPTVDASITLTQISAATNDQTFYAPTVSAAIPAQNLDPALFANDQTFYAPTVSTAITLTQTSAASNAQTFNAPTVAPGVVALTQASTATNSQTFYAPAVAPEVATVVPALVVNESQLYGPTVEALAPSIRPNRLDNSQAFYVATVATGLVELAQGGQIENTQSFYELTVSSDSGAKQIAVGLIQNESVFYSANLEGGEPVQQGQAAAGSNKKRRDKRRKVIVDGVMYDIPERDIPALLEAKLLGRKPPVTAKVEPVKAKAAEPAKASVTMPVVAEQPTVDEAAQRYMQLAEQLHDDVRKMLDRVALRVLAELEDEEEAAALLLLL